jgi:SAM-dependent methyltransferase
MTFWNSPFITLHPELPTGWTLYVCQIRTGRSKARIPAIMEILALLDSAIALNSGPLAEQKGVFWIGTENADEARFQHLGYTSRVLKLLDTEADETEPVRWRGKTCFLKTIYEEDKDWLRNRAPDKREFLLRTHDGQVLPVQGYRGDGQHLSRRGLAPEDARLLVNLVTPHSTEAARFLDPFAGVGGLVIEAVERGWQVYSGDIDPVVQVGLRNFGADHTVMDAARLPFPAQCFDAIATEPPFHEDARGTINGLMSEFDRVLKPGSKVAVLVAAWEADVLEVSAEALGFTLLLSAEIDRKGSSNRLCLWQKPL